MALSGLSYGWSKAGEIGPIALWIAWALLLLAALAFAFNAIGLAAKTLLRPDTALADLVDIQGIAGFSAGAIALMTIGQLCAPAAPDFGAAIWLGGTLVQIAVSMGFAIQLLSGRLSFVNANPVWLLVLSGALVAPIGGMISGYEGLASAAFGMGLFGVALSFPLIVVRMSFHERPPRGGALAHLLIPPAAGFNAYVALSGSVDHLAIAIFGVAAAVLVCLVRIAPALFRNWEAAYPLAQFSAALITLSLESDSNLLRSAGWFTLLGASLGLGLAGLNEIARRDKGQ